MHLPMGTTGIRYTLPRSRSRSRSLRMCMCMCLCMSMCMSISIPVSMSRSMIWSMSMCMCTCMCICICMRAYMCILYLCICTWLHVCVVYECASADNIIVVFLALVAFKVKVLDQIRTINRVQDGNDHWQIDSDSKFGNLKLGETKGGDIPDNLSWVLWWCFSELIDYLQNIKGKNVLWQEIPHEGAFGDIVWSDPEDIESWAAEA